MDTQAEAEKNRDNGESPVSRENIAINGEASQQGNGMNGTSNGMNGTSNGKVSPLEKPVDTPAEKPDDEAQDEPGCMAKMCGGGEKKKEEETPMIGVCQITRFATGVDALLMFIGCLFAAAHGAALPYMIIVFGDMIDAFTGIADFCTNCATGNLSSALIQFNNATKNDFVCDSLLEISGEKAKTFQDYLATQNVTLSNGFDTTQMLDKVAGFAIQYSIIGVIVLFVAYIRVTFWNMAAKRQAHLIRLKFFKSVLRQNIGWFDVNPQGELNNRLTDDIDKIEAGIGDKLGGLVFIIAQTVACITVGFIYGWKLTLVISATSPLLMLAAALMDKVGTSSTEGEQKAYASAGAVAEEVVSSIRTVVAFGGQEKECERYNSKLSNARAFGVRRGIATGFAMGLIMFIMFMVYALGFWYGSTLILADEMTTGNMLIVFFSIMIAAFGAGQLGPSIQALAVARGAAHFVFGLIDRIPEIDTESEAGLQPDKAIGNITFKNVHFQYPSRPDVKVLQGLDLNVEVGKTVALVGSSGCGKSTTVQLVQRFYDVISGEVQFDGRDIRELNIKWLRNHIGIVSQEPILFATTISENIRYGRDDVTDEEIIAASRKANADDFISKLPQKYETLVGSRGAQLSGGQKQRIAIARALVHMPKVLLLDEATSALDTESEASVQQALEVASAGRTTIVIAHRLSTVQNADKIVAFSEGKVAEQGTHSELMKLDGIYAKLVKNQLRKEEHPEDDEEEELAKEAEWVKSHSVTRKPSTHRSNSVEQKDLNRTLSNGSTKPADPDDIEADEKKEEKTETVGFCELLSWNSKEWYLIALGCFCALITGGSQPAFAVVFSKLLATFISCDDDKVRANANLYSGIFVGLAFAMFIAEVLMRLTFAVSGERLTERIRAKAFRSYLRQDVTYYDLPENNTGAITTRLATETSAIQGATGASLGSLFNALANIGVGMVIAFVYCWQLTLAILAFVPALLIAGFVEMKVLQGGQNQNKKLYEQAGKISVETIENIRTVQGLCKETLFYDKYVESTDVPYKKELRMTQGIGLTYAISQGLIFFAYAGLFYLGAKLINDGIINFEEMMITFSAVVFGAMSLGQAASFGPSFSKGSQAAGHIKKLENSVPTIDAYSNEGKTLSNVAGQVEFSNVDFHYPTRPEIQVLKQLSVSVEPGQTLALVGSSGCGKSTTVQLIERFYDSLGGQVLLSGVDIKDLNVGWLRQQIGLVSQEPILFDRSIADNIRYGDNNREVPMNEVISAAQSANIHNFIVTLPDGYDTSVGDKGTQLSGGQKQRVAIARALLRNPKILLLDEATSALDSESEKVVQEALDAAQKGRTSIVIAHRLSTIQNADKIAVIRHGQVTEIGTHAELLAQKGFYYKLQNIQKQQN